MPTLFSRRAALLGIPALLLAGTAAGAAWMMRPPPADLDLSLRKATEAGLYVAGLAPEAGPAAVGPMQSWIVSLETAGGEPVEGARIAIDGGMPQHGHGLPTAPAVTAALGGGRYRVEGMRFNMGGWWELHLAIDGAAGADAVTFNLVL